MIVTAVASDPAVVSGVLYFRRAERSFADVI